MYQSLKPLYQIPVFVLLFITSGTIHAESIESLLMPGPVIKSHEKFEHDCTNCHDTGSKKRQGQLCVNCHSHENILEEISKNKGFHGHLPKSSRDNCKHCHTEHQGRDAKVVLLNPTTFDHSKTDFVLKGVHKKTVCQSCHKSGKKYSEAPGKCYSCHKKSDVHKGKQGKKCEKCHKATGWRETGFDHDKTDFPLKGTHKKTACNACHITQKYKDTPKKCYSCHQINDVHQGSFGKKCNTCHKPSKWKKAWFDHNKKTDFPLYGKHKKAACSSCHTPGKKKQKLATKCYGCHKNDDKHKGKYGKKCQTCHTSSSWQKQKFNHNKTDFPLRGKHKSVGCDRCHKADPYKEKIKTNCITCHKQDDAHKGKQGKNCGECHNEKGWSTNVQFDHDLANFPLIGMHATTECGECHLSTNYRDTESDCNTCHADDDVHKTRLGTDCESCHNPNAWDTWIFDHNKATNFKIDGAHKDLGCYDCHKTPSKGKLVAASDCIACHRSDDIHNRQFGRQCGKCHTTKSFKDIDIKR